GVLLRHEHMHGAVKHLILEEQRLYVATDFGQFLVWDLSAFYQPYCELLNRVWDDVPVVWQSGRPQLAVRPASHPCAQAGADSHGP
ncbi:MAG: hypothetical protein VB934_22300, partial [Polyangiaceae bacterium]